MKIRPINENTVQVDIHSTTELHTIYQIEKQEDNTYLIRDLTILELDYHGELYKTSDDCFLKLTQIEENLTEKAIETFFKYDPNF